VHANSPLVFSTVWATMSLFKTSAHIPQKALALATFATVTFSKAGNWFSEDGQASLMAEGYTEDQAKAVLGLSFNLKLVEFMPLYCFDKKDNAILALAYHMVWYAAMKASDGNTERADKVRVKVREKLAEELSPLQLTELTWRISFCLALIWNNDFLIGDKIYEPPAKEIGVNDDLVLDPQARFRTQTVQNSVAQSPPGSPSMRGRGMRARNGSTGSIGGRGERRGSFASNPYASPGASPGGGRGSPTTPQKGEACTTCDTQSKIDALTRVRHLSECPFCKKRLK